MLSNKTILNHRRIQNRRILKRLLNRRQKMMNYCKSIININKVKSQERKMTMNAYITNKELYAFVMTSIKKK